MCLITLSRSFAQCRTLLSIFFDFLSSCPESRFSAGRTSGALLSPGLSREKDKDSSSVGFVSRFERALGPGVTEKEVLELEETGKGVSELEGIAKAALGLPGRGGERGALGTGTDQIDRKEEEGMRMV